MIIHSFDHSEPIISPGNFYGPRGDFCDICIVTFSHHLHSTALASIPHDEIGRMQACNGITPIYRFNDDGVQYALYLSSIGSACAATDIIDAAWITGATKFVMFGSAGCLDSKATRGKYVIPTAAYRAEGMSYHYAPPSDYIEIPTASKTAAIFEEMGVPYVCGKVWTTDAIYRETKEQYTARKNEGCLAVEMELAGVQAVCDYYGFEMYDFLETGDVLDAEEYTPQGLHKANHDLKKLRIAREIAKRIS